MALKNTDRVTSKHLRAGDVVLTDGSGGQTFIRPAESLTGNLWRTVDAPATSELQYPAHSTRGTRFYRVTFTDGTTSVHVAPSQHWTRANGERVADQLTAELQPTVDALQAEHDARQLADIVARVDAAAERLGHTRPVEPTTRPDSEPYEPPADADGSGERCGACKGFGLVRGIGSHAGGRYKTLAGAQAAQGAGRAVDCPTCEGTGLAATVRELIKPTRVDSMDAMITAVLDDPAHFQIITVGR